MAYQLVAKLLQKVAGTDRGADASEDLQNEVLELIKELEDIGQAQASTR